MMELDSQLVDQERNKMLQPLEETKVYSLEAMTMAMAMAMAM